MENEKNWKTAMYVAVTVIFIGIILYLVRWIILTRLPEEDVHIPISGIVDTLTIPPRPGIEGIVIEGPKIDSLVFEIDASKTIIKSLDWKRLVKIDKNAYVRIQAMVDTDGNLKFRTKSDVFAEGKPDAAIEISSVLRTWKYTSYKSGPIRFLFHVAARGKKFTVDIRSLKRNPDIPKSKKIYNGLLYCIEGLELQKINKNGKVEL
ncbi:hypothetical protein H8E88_29135 [candidate division KSB1 bacterium]|nr:hypothetical protein [candidate division KSB1 bacterium]MBL7094745.1 hypothetical protein [candidate division KSB1 bacterium]